LSRIVSAPEREELRRRVEKRLVNLCEPDGHFEEDLDVSDRLIDRCIAMQEANRLAYIGFDICTKRSLELVGVTRDPLWTQSPDVSGFLRMKPADDDERAPLNTQFELLQAMQRRGIALECADLLSFDLHEVLRRRLLNALTKEAKRGFLRVDLEQVLDTDQIVWRGLAKATRNGIKRRHANTRPLDGCIMAVLDSLDVQMSLMQRQGYVPPPQPAIDHAGSKIVQALQKQIDALQRQVSEGGRAKAIKDAFSASSSTAPMPAIADRPTADSKGKKNAAQDSKNGRDPKPPAELKGCCTRSSQASGRRKMCYAYNLGNCKKVADGGECSRGAHLCMKNVKGSACSQPHPQCNHTGR
jgi:hypothetical protein